MGTKWLSIRRLKVHEYLKTIRRLQGTQNPKIQSYLRLSEIERGATKTFARLYLQCFAMFLALTSLREGAKLQFSILDFSVSVQTAYALAITSGLVILTTVSFNHLSVAMSAKVRLGNSIQVQDISIRVFEMINTPDEPRSSDTSLGTPVLPYSFLREIIPISSLLGIGLMLFLLVFLVPGLALIAFLTKEQYLLAANDELFFLERLSSLFGGIASAFAALNLFLFHAPFPFRKNRDWIRWGFLFRVQEFPHRRAEYWIKEKR